MLLPSAAFPDIRLSLVGGSDVSLPEDLAGSWAYIVFYRGGW
jgi:hypothetical protein